MYILEVIPLTILPPQVPQLLSYFFNKLLLKGAVVEVLLNNRRITAIVVSCELVENQKITLKKSRFQLKKISNVLSENSLVSENQFKIALWLSKNYFSPLGLCLKTVLPVFFQKNKPVVKNVETIPAKPEKPVLLLSRSKQTIKHIEPKIKKTLKNKRQILIVVPEISIAKYFYEYFSSRYETSLVHGKIPKKQYFKSWENISSGETEIIIGTRQSLFCHFYNLGLIIMEDPSNEAYKSDMSPKYNTRDLAEKIAEINSSHILFVSQISDVKDFYAIKTEFLKLNDKTTSLRPAIKIENMLPEIIRGNHSVFSQELRNNIDKYFNEKKKILIFSTRKGYSTSLLCENCRFFFNCPKCSTPFRIYTSPEQLLICNKCSTTQKIPDHCPNCKSYKLKAAGFAGSEKIKDELSAIFPGKEIFVFDTHVIKNIKQEEELASKMENTESFICIATQAIFGQRFNLEFDLVGVPNLDSLITVPDFKAEESLFLQVEKLIDFNPQKIIIQTLHTKNQILDTILSGNYTKLYDDELKVRKLFWYPPFARLIKLSFSFLDKNKVGYEARILSEKLKMVILQMKFEESAKLMDPSPAFIEKQRGLYIYNIILKIEPSFKISDILKFVPSNWMVDVDPKAIL